MNRANRSDSRPNASGSTCGREISARRASRGWSRRNARVRGSRATGAPGHGGPTAPGLLLVLLRLVVVLAPVLGQDVVEDVVHRDRTQQVPVRVDDRSPDQVV